MKRFATLIFASFIFALNLFAQTDKTISEKIIQLTPDGYITLGKDIWAYINYDMNDAWGGIIEPLDESYQIKFWSGTVVPAIDEKNKKIKWKKQKAVNDGILIYALEKSKKKQFILAQFSDMNFSQEISNESEIDKFLEIIGKYKSGRCDECFNSRTAKIIVKAIKRKRATEQKKPQSIFKSNAAINFR